MSLLASNKEIGKYLRKLTREHGHKNDTDFDKAYLDEKYGHGNWNEDNLKTTKNTFSQILNGQKGITTEQLMIVSKLLCVSCEEILSAGKHYVPTKNHVTNYEIAQSKNKKVWDEYMKREDDLFINCDEYGKTVIDYALEFKNYAFIKYLIDEDFIWFVDKKEHSIMDYAYGAGTSIKPKKPKTNNYLDSELKYQDELRTQTIALAIECGDFDILDSMRAREIPELRRLCFTNIDNDFNKSRNENLIEAVAMTESEKVIKYFSDEFIVQDNTFMFPFLNEVIEKMLDNGNEKNAEIVIRKAIEHNKTTYDKLSDLIAIDGSYMDYSEEMFKIELSRIFKYNPQNNCVTINALTTNHNSALGCSVLYLITNIFKVKSKTGSPEIKALIKELNEWHNKIISLGGEENG